MPARPLLQYITAVMKTRTSQVLDLFLIWSLVGLLREHLVSVEILTVLSWHTSPLFHCAFSVKKKKSQVKSVPQGYLFFSNCVTKARQLWEHWLKHMEYLCPVSLLCTQSYLSTQDGVGSGNQLEKKSLMWHQKQILKPLVASVCSIWTLIYQIAYGAFSEFFFSPCNTVWSCENTSPYFKMTLCPFTQIHTNQYFHKGLFNSSCINI